MHTHTQTFELREMKNQIKLSFSFFKNLSAGLASTFKESDRCGLHNMLLVSALGQPNASQNTVSQNITARVKARFPQFI